MPEMSLLGIKPRSPVGKTRANEQLYQRGKIKCQRSIRLKTYITYLPCQKNEKIKCGYGQEYVERTHLEQLRTVTRLLPQIP